MGIYNASIQRAIRSIPNPVPGVRVAIVEYPGGTLAVRVFEDQIMDLPEFKRVQVMSYLEEMMAVIKSFGIKTFPEGIKGKPPV